MQGLSIIWAGLFTYPYGPWLIITALFLCSFFLRNELKVKIKLHLSKEMMLSARIDALEESSKQREKQLQKIKALEARSSMNSSFIDSKKLFVSRQSVVRR